MGRARPDLTGVVKGPLACERCGYALASMSRWTLCPECGLPVAWTTEGRELRYSARRYRERVASGLGLMAAAVGLLVAGACAGRLVPSGMWWQAPGAALTLLSLVLECVGVWRFTAPDPAYVFVERGFARRAAPWAAVGRCGTLIVQCAAFLRLRSLVWDSLFANVPGGGAIAVWAWVEWVAAWSSVVLWCAAVGLALSHGATLAGRVPDAALRRRLRVERWVVPGVIAACSVASALASPWCLAALAPTMAWYAARLVRLRRCVLGAGRRPVGADGRGTAGLAAATAG